MDEAKLSRMMDKLTEIGERLVVVETLLKERSSDTDTIYKTLRSHADRITDLERYQSKVVGAKDIFTWLAITAIGLYGVIKS